MIDLLAIALHIYGETGNEPKIQNSDVSILCTTPEPAAPMVEVRLKCQGAMKQC